MSHSQTIRAINSKTTKVLKGILNQWDDFLKTMSAFTREQEKDFLKDLVITHELIKPYDLRMDYMLIPSEDVIAIVTTNNETSIVFMYIINRLEELNAFRRYEYQFPSTKEKVWVFVWIKDIPKFQKHLKYLKKKNW